MRMAALHSRKTIATRHGNGGRIQQRPLSFYFVGNACARTFANIVNSHSFAFHRNANVEPAVMTTDLYISTIRSMPLIERLDDVDMTAVKSEATGHPNAESIGMTVHADQHLLSFSLRAGCFRHLMWCLRPNRSNGRTGAIGTCGFRLVGPGRWRLLQLRRASAQRRIEAREQRKRGVSMCA